MVKNPIVCVTENMLQKNKKNVFMYQFRKNIRMQVNMFASMFVSVSYEIYDFVN